MVDYHVSYGSISGASLDMSAISLVSQGSSRSHVIESLGSPSFSILHNGNRSQSFYYVSQKKKWFPVKFLSPKIMEYIVLKITFGEKGVVSSVSMERLPNRRFNPNPHTIPAPIQTADGFLRRLLNPNGRSA
ncbi:hypothetical protein CGUJ_01940 [Candidatus Liberibacter asiaticus str. Ishi-1]|nr:hypothetical protein CGUJ_01940 [Candidatus Liberibacter asiaticus str. Ishi-1]